MATYGDIPIFTSYIDQPPTMLDRVPYEIFREIIKSSYTHCSHITSFNFDEIVLPPIKATHVCRSWRVALLSDSIMWSCIKLRTTRAYLEELKEILPRSGAAPLNVLIEQRVNLHNSHLIVNLSSVLSIVSQEMHRCRQLQIIIPEQLAPSISHSVNRPAPMLRRFYLEVVGGKDSSTQRDMFKGIYGVLFSGDAPRLQHVHLQVAAGLDDLQLFLFQNLSSLHLQFISKTTIDGDILLGIFQSSPHLRILDIMCSRPRPKIVCSMPCNHRIPLPFLQELSLRGSCRVDIINFVLEHLEFSMEKVKFNIMCGDSRPRISGSASLLHLLAQRHLTFLSISLDLFQLILKFSEKMDEGLAGSVFRATYNDTRNGSMNRLPNFLRTFNLSDITHMCLGGISLDPVFLRSSMKNLQHLRIYRWDEDENPLLFGSSLRIQRLYLEELMPRHSNPQTQGSSESETDDRNTDPKSNIEGTPMQIYS